MIETDQGKSVGVRVNDGCIIKITQGKRSDDCVNDTRSLLTASYLPLKNLIGQPLSYFTLFFPPMVFTVFLLYFFLPETKGKTPSEVEEEWDNLPTLCKSRENHQQPDLDPEV
ncbi:hypothetical protein Y032_0027g1551 [Ancylostoma ceylanicum]|nr:hypothetical protein Y032_0027g1551 [Ancylostoma ceylanicum]